MENKSLFSAIVLAFTLIATYTFYNNKVVELEQDVSEITQEYNLKLSALTGDSQKDKKESKVSALEDLNNQLIKARSALKISEEKLSLVASKTHVLGNEISQMSDARDKVKTLQGSLQSTQKKLTLSADKVQYLEQIFETQNKSTIVNNIARIKELKETTSGIAITGLIVPAIGVATLVSYTTEEINNYCNNIQNIMSLENKVFGKIVSLDSQMQSNYHNQCEVSFKDRIKQGLKKLKITPIKN
jgi:peptidyl-tRNA hydrolase